LHKRNNRKCNLNFNFREDHKKLSGGKYELNIKNTSNSYQLSGCRYRMDIVFVVDNRVGVRTSMGRGIELGAAEEAAVGGAVRLIARYINATRKHPWLPTPLSVLIAASPHTTRALVLGQRNMKDLADALVPRFSVGHSGLWPYLIHALSSLGELKMRRSALVIVLAGDAALGGSLAGSSNALVRAVSPGTILRLLCPVVTAAPFDTEVGIETENVTDARRMLQETGLTSSVHCFPNTSLHFDEQLRSILDQFATPIRASLELPRVPQVKLSNLELELSSRSLATQDHLHEGLYRPIVIHLAKRAPFDPLLLAGDALIVRPAPLTDSKLRDANELTFRALHKTLIARDRLLILRTPLRQTCYQFWALVPGNSLVGVGHMALLRLLDNENLLRAIIMGDNAFVDVEDLFGVYA
jgi:hypothetical protein